MNQRWYRVMLALLLITGIIAAGYASWQRFQIELSMSRVELAMPYNELQSLARQTGKSPLEVMELFKEQGLTAVFYKEPTAEELSRYNELICMSASELFTIVLAGSGSWLYDLFEQGKILVNHTCLITTNRDLARQIEEQLKIKTAEVKSYSFPERKIFIICSSVDKNVLENLGLGFPAEIIKESESIGLNAIVQLRSWPGVTASGLCKVFEPIGNIHNLSAIAFNDDLPGYPRMLPELKQQIQEIGVPVVQIEFFRQRGLTQLGLLLNKKIILLHSVKPEEMSRLSINGLKRRFVLAASERNARVLLFYPFMSAGTGNLLEKNVDFISELSQELRQKGLTVGRTLPPPPLAQSKWLLFFMGLGVIAGFLLVLEQSGVKNYKLLVIMLTVLWGLLLIKLPKAGQEIMALAAAVIFPVYSMVLNLKTKGVPPWKSVLLLLETTFLSLIGAVFVVGLLADSRYMLKIDQFTGVKLAYGLPLLLLVGMVYLKKTRIQDLIKLLNQPLLIKWAMVSVILVSVLVVYFLRTGAQEILPPSSLELKARDFLADILVVRPRTKEFLFGHPFLLLLFYTGYKDNRFLPLLLFGAIGQISIINTFIHLHTPLYISLIRVFNGLWIGILVGLILIAFWNLVVKIYNRVYER